MTEEKYTVVCRETLLCPICGIEHAVERRQRDSGAVVKGLQVRFREEYCACLNADVLDNEFWTGEMADENLQRARAAYAQLANSNPRKKE